MSLRYRIEVWDDGPVTMLFRTWETAAMVLRKVKAKGQSPRFSNLIPQRARRNS